MNHSPDIYFRMADIHDIPRLLSWRNEPSARSASHNREPINYKDHYEWFMQKITDKNYGIYIIEWLDQPVGVIRTQKENDTTTLSWFIDPEYRRCGFCKEAVKKIVQQLDGTITAEIKCWNLSSKRVAEYAGLQFSEQKGFIHIYTKT